MLSPEPRWSRALTISTHGSRVDWSAARQPSCGVRRPPANCTSPAELAGIENVTLAALAGEQYRTILLNSQWPSEVHMQGLGIGPQPGG
jgi:hypothetical protein